MRKIVLAGLLALGVLGTVGVRPARSAITKDDIDRAVAQGVAALKGMQQQDGSWTDPDRQLGPTALAAITLLECKVDPNDKAVAAAVAYVRQACVRCEKTYSIALAIILLDLVGDPADVPLMESLGVRLLAGQGASGGWGYACPQIPESELQRLLALGRTGGTTELKTRRPGAEPGKKPAARDVSPEIKQQLLQLAAAAGGAGAGEGDNSNTQFATLALWVCRRISLPVEGALGRVEARFRGSQGEDGGWGYTPRQMRMVPPPGANIPPEMRAMMGGSSTPTMTCAGALGLLVAHGVLADIAREKRTKPREYDKDPQLMASLMALSTAIGEPIGDRQDIRPPQAGGRSFYFLWSLERVCVALELEKLNKKDWYTWGAEILLANQRGGSWQGEFANTGADTCFALLFLVKANLLRDLNIKGKMNETTMRAGGLGGGSIRKPPPGLKAGIEGNARPGTERTRPGGGDPVATRPPKPVETNTGDSDSARLAKDLLKAPPGEQGAIIQRLQETKGVENTEALAFAIPRLDGDVKQKAREALTARLTRLKAESLAKYLEDEEAEIRRAAALAIAAKGIRAAIPKLIPHLRDRNEGVAQAVLAALKELSGKDLGNTPGEWEAWWAKQGN